MHLAANTAFQEGVQSGYVFGFILMGLLLLVGGVFFIVALVKAFTKKTKGWIITSIVMGVLGILMVVGLAVAGIAGVARFAAEGAKIDQVLITKGGRFQIMVPHSWTLMPHLNPTADIAAGNTIHAQFTIVFVEEKTTVGATLDDYMKFTSDRMASNMQDGIQGELTEPTIDGRRALRRSITGKREGVALAFLHTCLETDGQLVQIICWTITGREKSVFPIFEKVAATFSPKGKTPAPDTTAPVATPEAKAKSPAQ